MPTPIQLADDAPWRQRLRARTLGYAYVAPSAPHRGIVHMAQEDPVRQIYAWDVPGGGLRKLTDKAGGIAYAWLDPVAEFLYFLQDDRGSEIGHMARIPYDGGPHENLTPTLPAYTLRGFDISASGNRLAFAAVTEDGYRFYCMDLHPNNSFGPPRLIFHARQETWACHLSHDGRLLAVKSTARAPRSRRYSTLVFDTETGRRVAELWDGEDASVEPVQFSPVPGDDRLLATTTVSGAARILFWHPRTGQRTELPLPQLTGSVTPLDWSADGSRLLLQATQDGEKGLFVYHLATDSLIRLKHPPGTFRGRTGPFHTGAPGTFFGPDGTVWAQWSDAAHPPQLLSLTPNQPPRPVLPVPDCPTGQSWRSVEFPSSDGVSVQAWLGLPRGKTPEDGPFATILHVHGGPSAMAGNTFDPSSQMWLDHGFAFLSVNYRGSTGFGRAFQEKINGDVGHWELEDILAARRWLIDQGIANPQAILMEGGSYGGFLTIWALSQRPDLWAGGIAPVAIVDWLQNYEDSSGAMQGWAHMIFDGPPQEKADLYRNRSPVTHAAAIQAPLVIFQGRKDSRATPTQMERFQAKMKELGKDCAIIWLDAGHGTTDTSVAEQIQETHLRFAYRILGLPT